MHQRWEATGPVWLITGPLTTYCLLPGATALKLITYNSSLLFGSGKTKRLVCVVTAALSGVAYASCSELGARSAKLARMLPIGHGGLQSGFSVLRYVRRDFRKKNRVRGLPAPPGGGRSWVPWCDARKGCLARAIGPSGGPCHPPARPR
jgi:hypothetical protein